jgi:hypothetical protein
VNAGDIHHGQTRTGTILRCGQQRIALIGVANTNGTKGSKMLRRRPRQQDSPMRQLIKRRSRTRHPVGRCTVLDPTGMDGHALMANTDEYVPIPCQSPTEYPPGSPHKIQEMRERMARCEELFHADDYDHLEGVESITWHKRSTRWQGLCDLVTHAEWHMKKSSGAPIGGSADSWENGVEGRKPVYQTATEGTTDGRPSASETRSLGPNIRQPD